MIMNPAAIDLSVLPSLPLECRSKLPPVACIYFAIDSMGQIQYVGRSANLRNRWTIHHRTNQLKQLEGVKIAWLEVSDPSLLPEIEAALINWFTPLLNGSNIQGTTNRFGLTQILPKS
jgi:excinuclease UvrABC nuclease subunit